VRTAAVARSATPSASWTLGRVADMRKRPGGTVAQIAAAEALRSLPPAAYPAQIAVGRKASRKALVAFEDNHYSVASAHAGKLVTVTWQGETDGR
jgi:beta-phosphoglucomutase-like phosphatase (HAD superfamily)